jgi:hypothetical protein
MSMVVTGHCLAPQSFWSLSDQKQRWGVERKLMPVLMPTQEQTREAH